MIPSWKLNLEQCSKECRIQEFVVFVPQYKSIVPNTLGATVSQLHIFPFPLVLSPPSWRAPFLGLCICISYFLNYLKLISIIYNKRNLTVFILFFSFYMSKIMIICWGYRIQVLSFSVADILKWQHSIYSPNPSLPRCYAVFKHLHFCQSFTHPPHPANKYLLYSLLIHQIVARHM